ncbi:MAG: hypothetical protein JO108_16445 [Acidobacteriaceae bacterium]|nr:hypothetical protein [Acidobacteriaceae bacterium]
MHGPVPLSRRAFIVGTPLTCAAAESVTGWAGEVGTVNTPGSVSRVISVEAKRDRLDLDLSKTAVMVVDMQNDFAAKGGLVDRRGFDIQPIRATIQPISHVLSAGRLRS